ncbi:SGF29 tudor-like domain-containing protein [Fimicolochytrium jonesii]|uniref:SGF29 tudor-like domain-containing protein n=1 Tax=Fimicolochytrium jonesii TaxID=1396493 RepID=UPI0022FEC0D1|nr:SGF29 tudor-like domain-containing protein [Fimicolochytrium jonesii]KAI8821666.1 SGF29 tudor-like domain-containing protein [Fimicolochytrium jonesii]
MSETKRKSRHPSLDTPLPLPHAHSGATATSNEHGLWIQLCQELWRFSRQLPEVDAAVPKVNSVHTKIIQRQENGKDFHAKGAMKILSLYERANSKIAEQTNFLTTALDKTAILLLLRENHDATTPTPDSTHPSKTRKKRKLDEKGRVGVGAGSPTAPVIVGEKPHTVLLIPGNKKGRGGAGTTDPLRPGQQVIARPTQPHATEWIMGTVERYIPERGLYLFTDAEDEDGALQPKTPLYFPPRDLIPLPATDTEIAKKQIIARDKPVLALYPGTTCFYRGRVKSGPTKASPNEYKIVFEDDQNQERAVPARMVVDAVLAGE